jgi:hypothetical protein
LHLDASDAALREMRSPWIKQHGLAAIVWQRLDQHAAHDVWSQQIQLDLVMRCKARIVAAQIALGRVACRTTPVGRRGTARAREWLDYGLAAQCGRSSRSRGGGGALCGRSSRAGGGAMRPAAPARSSCCGGTGGVARCSGRASGRGGGAGWGSGRGSGRASGGRGALSWRCKSRRSTSGRGGCGAS